MTSTHTISNRISWRWKKVTPLTPLLQKHGLHLIERKVDNFGLAAYPGLIIKDSYWRWPEREKAGNIIDSFVQLMGMSLHDAMRQITGT